MRSLIGLFVVSLLALGCSSTPSSDDAGPSGDAGGSESWSACGYAAAYRIASLSVDAGNCPDLAGGLVTLEQSDARSGVLNLGGDRLPVTLGAGCVITGGGCTGFDGGGDWVSAQVSGSPTGSGVKLDWSGARIRGHDAVSCPSSASLSLTPIDPGCDLAGPWTMDAAPALTSGTCETSWSADLSIAPGDGGYDLALGGEHFGEVPQSAGACALSLTRGRLADGGADDFWLYNSTMRRATVSLTEAGGALSGTIDDALQDDSAGVHCPGGRFTFSAHRPTLAGDAIPSTCTDAKPFIDRNGVCEAELGETCFSTDCACVTPSVCVSGAIAGTAPTCKVPCGYFTEDCASGQRCDVVYPSDSPGYCGPAGAGVEASACGTSADCAAGFACLQGRTAPPGDSGVCASKCGSGASCAAGSICVSEVGASGFDGCLPACGSAGECASGQACRFTHDWTGANVAVCVLSTGTSAYGQSCNASTGAGCASGQGCSTIGNGTVQFATCVPLCQSSADCPADFPTCSLGYCGPF